jgi:hypothetical protein
MAEGEQQDLERERIGSIKALADLNAILTQLDNTPILQKAKCRFMAGFFDKNSNFHRWIEINAKDPRKPKMNDKGWMVVEHFLDKNTCPNETLSNKSEDQIKINCLVEGLVLLDDLTRHYREYAIDLDDIQYIVIMCVALAFSGQKRALHGETAKAINKVIKQIESIVREDKEKKMGVLDKLKL